MAHTRVTYSTTTQTRHTMEISTDTDHNYSSKQSTHSYNTGNTRKGVAQSTAFPLNLNELPMNHFPNNYSSTNLDIPQHMDIQTSPRTGDNTNRNIGQRQIGFNQTPQQQKVKTTSPTKCKSMDGLDECGSLPVPIVTNGFYIWNIRNFQNELRKCEEDRNYHLTSPHFTDALFSYSIKALVYLNGSSISNTGQISVYLAICKGDYDAILQWPFKYNVLIELLDQSGENKPKRKFIEANNSDSFMRPTDVTNTPIGGNNFCSNKLDEGHLSEDTIFFKFTFQN